MILKSNNNIKHFNAEKKNIVDTLSEAFCDSVHQKNIKKEKF